jgi:DNA replication protein DnaC
LRSIDVLLLDDLGIEKGSAFTMRELFGVIDERTKKGLATIVTSNQKIAEVFGRNVDPKSPQLNDDQRDALALGERIFSRLKEDRYVVEWPKATTDWRDEAFKLKQKERATITSDRERRVRELREQLDSGEQGEAEDGQ